MPYQHYISQVPKEERPANLPQTPNKNCSSRSCEECNSSIKAWKVGIHAWYQRDLEISNETLKMANLGIAENSPTSPVKSPRKFA